MKHFDMIFFVLDNHEKSVLFFENHIYPTFFPSPL